MLSTSVFLPNGQTVTVLPLAGDIQFSVDKSNPYCSMLPPLWHVVLCVRGQYNPPEPSNGTKNAHESFKLNSDGFKTPSLRNDSLTLKTLAATPQQTAMILWATLWWYFHQTPPDPHLTTESSIPKNGRPKGDWRLNITRQGHLANELLLSQLERRRLITVMDSTMAPITNEKVDDEDGREIFTSQRAFWQLDPRCYLCDHSTIDGTRPCNTHSMAYYPPPPTQYILTDSVRHPTRPKPPGRGETFYTRFISSVGQFLSFRTVSLPPHAAAVHRLDSTVQHTEDVNWADSSSALSSDIELLHKWMNEPRVAAFWGLSGPHSVQQEYLISVMKSKHSFPVIGCWDSKPFGYFEIYWAKEDRLGKYAGADVTDWDRGIHALVGEQQFRGNHRVRIWLNALAHFCWLADCRTQNVFLEPRVDNQRFIGYIEEVGFHKQREIAFPHKQAALMRMNRETWVAPEL